MRCVGTIKIASVKEDPTENYPNHEAISLVGSGLANRPATENAFLLARRRLSELGRPAAHASRHRSIHAHAVRAQELQNGLLLVLAMFASMALVNLGAELSALARHWHSFIEFLWTIFLCF